MIFSKLYNLSLLQSALILYVKVSFDINTLFKVKSCHQLHDIYFHNCFPKCLYSSISYLLLSLNYLLWLQLFCGIITIKFKQQFKYKIETKTIQI